MSDVLSLLSDAQFVLAQVLWEPRLDRDRALELAKIAMKMHPDPRKRAAINEWLQVRGTQAIEELAIDELQRSLRGVTDAAETRPVFRLTTGELAELHPEPPRDTEIPMGLGILGSSPYLEINATWPEGNEDATMPCPYVSPNDLVTRPFERV